MDLRHPIAAPMRARVPLTWVPVSLGSDAWVTFVQERTDVWVAICQDGINSCIPFAG